MTRKRAPRARAAPSSGGASGTPATPAASDYLGDFAALETYRTAWLELTPGERLARGWALRSRMPDPAAVHDAKLFPRP